MIFEIHSERSANDKKIFYYDNMTNILKDVDGNVYEYPKNSYSKQNRKEYVAFDKNLPLKKSKG